MKHFRKYLFITILTIFYCSLQAQNNNTKINIPNSPKLSTLNDSLNYAYGVMNGGNIKSSFLKNDTTTQTVTIMMKSFDKVCDNIEKGEMYIIGLKTGKTFNEQKVKGLMGVSTLQFIEKFVKDGFNDALEENYMVFNPEDAKEYIQNAMYNLQEKNNQNETIDLKKLNYAYGLANGSDIKNEYLKTDLQKHNTLLFLEGMNDGLKDEIKDSEYTEIAKFGEQLGYSINEINKKGLLGDATQLSEKVNLKLLRHGLFNGLRGSFIQMSAEEALNYFQNAANQKLANQYIANKTSGEQFLSENKTKPGVFTTASGLQYKVIKKGKGEFPNDSSIVKIRYRGSLINDSVFDNSIDKNQVVQFKVNQVILGFSEALKLMPIGSIYKVFIPQNLAYGNKYTRSIKPFSTLIYDIELISIENPVYETYGRINYDDLPIEIQQIMKQCKCGEIDAEPTQKNNYTTNYNEGFAIDLNNDNNLEYVFCCQAPMHGPGDGKIYSLIDGKWKIIFDNFPIFSDCEPEVAINVLQTKSEKYNDLIVNNVKYKFSKGKYIPHN